MKDIIACIVIIGAFILKFKGADGVVSISLISVVAFYFGLKTPSAQDIACAVDNLSSTKKEVDIG
jgi:hypothetical protein